MSLGVVLIVVDTEHDGDVLVLSGSGDDHLLRTRRKMFGRSITVTEMTGRLDDDVDAEVRPRELSGVALAEDCDLVAVDHQAAVGDVDAARVVPVHRVVFEQVSERRRVGEIVHRDEVDVLAAGLLRAA